MTYTEDDVSTRINGVLGEHTFTPEQIGLLDQYHAGGIAAVDKLIPNLAVSTGDTVIDVGSGFGGPARRVAERTQASVLGVDITSSYVDAAQYLTTRTGFDGRVKFRHADIMTFTTDRPFDAALTMHVQMNVDDKKSWFAAINRTLAPAGRLAVWEVCTTNGTPPRWPMPWSLDGTDSFLATADQLLDAITTAGFHLDEWHDETDWVNEWSAATIGNGTASPALVLPMLLEDGATRVQNFAAALREGTVSVFRGAFTKAQQ